MPHREFAKADSGCTFGQKVHPDPAEDGNTIHVMPPPPVQLRYTHPLSQRYASPLDGTHVSVR